MSLFLTALMAMAAPASTGEASSITVTGAGSTRSAVGPDSYFTGKVRLDAPFQGTAPARVGGATVSFEPGARTAWHTHPLGQTLIVTTGIGWVQEWDKPRQALRPGDVVWIPPGVKHWHGASAEVAMSHIAIAEAVDGSPVTWLEQVSNAQYAAVEQ